MENKTKIILTRRSEWLNRTRSYKVFIDGAEAGSIRNGTSEEYPVEPGSHRIQCRIAWYSSPELVIDLSQNEIQYILVRNGMKYYWLLFILLASGVFINLISSGQQRPQWSYILRTVLILPALLYLLYYLTIGRKQYLIVEEDRDNVFAG